MDPEIIVVLCIATANEYKIFTPYIDEKEAVDALDQERVSFGARSYGSNLIKKRFNDEVFDCFLQKLATNTVTTHLSFKLAVLREQQAVKLMQGLETNETLQSLELLYNDISPESAKAITGLLKKNKYLKEIHIHCDNKGAIELAEALKYNSSLQKLKLSCGQIGDEGAIALAESLRVNTSLQELDLGYNNKITKAVLPHFCLAFRFNKTLETLEISNDNIRLFGNVAGDLRKKECKYNTLLPDGSNIKKAYSKVPPANDYSSATEEIQDGGDKRKPDVNPSNEQPADDILLSNNSEVPLPNIDDHGVPPAGEASDIE